MTRKKTGGRVAGTPNRVSCAVRDNVVNVFNKIGGEEGLAEWAKENRTEYYRLWGRLLPKQINSDISTETNRPVNELSDGELIAIIKEGQQLKAVK